MTQIIIKYPGRDEIIRLTKDIVSFGRGSKNDITTQEEGISRHHCEIRKIEDDHYIVDLGSRNGTYVNKQRVKEQKLALGDRITIGRLTIVFEQEIPYPEESKTSELSQISDFVVIAQRKQWGPALLAIGIIILGIAALVIWRTWANRPVAPKDKNLLGHIGSFDASGLQNGQMPLGWAVINEAVARGSINQQETHSEPNALMIEKFHPTEFYAECRYEPLVKLSQSHGVIPAYRAGRSPGMIPSVEAYSFGGWVKAEPFNKNLAGFRLEWFRPDENIPFAEVYTQPFVPSEAWEERTILVSPFQDAQAVRFTCLMAGTVGKVYFDGLKITPKTKSDLSQHSFEDKGFQKETTNLVLRGTQAGTWSLHTREGLPLLRCGGLVIGSKTGESFQGFSDPANGNTPGVSPRGGKAGQGKIPFSDPLKWLEYKMDFGISEHLNISYFIPYQEATLALTGSYIRFIVDPHAITGKIKILSEHLTEFSSNESIRKRGVSRMDLEIADHAVSDGLPVGQAGRQVLSIKYPQPLEVAIETRNNVLEFRQGWFDIDKSDLTQYGKEGIRLALEFEWSIRIDETASGVYSQMFEKAQRLERVKKLGQAINIYRKIVAEANQESKIWVQADKHWLELKRTAQARLDLIKRLIQEMDLLNDSRIFEQAVKLCQEIIKQYQGNEFAGRAKILQEQIQEKRSMVEAASLHEKINRLLALAEGYFREEQWVLARLVYQEIIRLGKSEDETVQKAQERLKEIEVKETMDKPE